MKWMSIDPGLKGGIVVWDDDAPKICLPMPVNGKDIDVKEIEFIVDEYNIEEAVIEKVGGLPGQSSAAGFTFGVGWGMIVGGLMMLGVKVNTLSPVAWQNQFHAGLARNIEPKDRSRMAAGRLFPNFVQELKKKGCRVIHDGMADALGIGYAWWGKK